MSALTTGQLTAPAPVSATNSGDKQSTQPAPAKREGKDAKDSSTAGPKKEEPKAAAGPGTPAKRAAGAAAGGAAQTPKKEAEKDKDKDAKALTVATDEKEKEAPEKKKRSLPSSARLGKDIRATIEKCLALLVPLLATREYLPPHLDLGFGDLAHGHLQEVLTDLSSFMLCAVPRESEGPVLSAPKTSPIQDLPALAEPGKAPLFYLVMAQVCRHLEKKEIPAVLGTLRRTFPATGARRGRGSDGGEPKVLFESDIPNLLNRTWENAQLLLHRYVEVSGLRMVTFIRGRQGAKAEPTAVRPYVVHIVRDVARIQMELQEMFPELKAADSDAGGSQQSAAPSARAPGGPAASPAAPRGGAAGRGGPAGSPGPAARGGAASPGRGGVSRYGRKLDKSTKEKKVNRDIELLFREKIRVFAPVKFNRTSPLVGILKIAFKALSELTRFDVLRAFDVHQMQLEVYAFRCELPRYLSPEDHKTLSSLLEEVMSSANDRCSETVSLIDDATLDKLYRPAQLLGSA